MKIFLIGTGIGDFQRISMQSMQILQSVDVIFHLSPHHGNIVNAAPQAEVHDLKDLYESNDEPNHVYDLISQHIYCHASNNQGTTAFVTYGHPLFFVRCSLDLMASDLDVELLPAISSFDTLLIDSPVHLGDGVQIFDTALFVAYNIKPSPLVPVALYQYGDFGGNQLRTKPDSRRFQLLQEQLLSIYPSDHLAHIVVSGWANDVSCSVVSFPIKQLIHNINEAVIGSSLVIGAK
ncbi:SAM-dependent methyltransferase [Vibrio pectenicida]|uniref:SAM-dependent methyltransferase n=1 Tax=Vibrio pectenicida TaxID=62763 RepID=UPI00148BD95F